MRTAQEFQQQAATHNITRWPHHDCAICSVWVAWLFVDDKVYFDSACGCSNFMSDPQPRTWWDVADFYNMQSSPKVIADMDAFWHFANAQDE